MQNENRINRSHKDRLFRFIFKEKETLLSLYNAINNSTYTDPDELEIYTMEDYVYMGMKNDISFLIDMNLNLFEHQSSYNPNMPLRGYLYIAAAIQKYLALNHLDLHSSGKITLPIPRYYIFYNGKRDMPEETMLKLTDNMAGDHPEDTSSVQTTAHMININAGHNPRIMERCPMLEQYARFVSEVRRRHEKGVDLSAAVDQTVDYCIRENILADILRGHKAEVTTMILEEYDAEFHIANEKELSYQEGLEAGIERGIEQGIKQGIERGRWEQMILTEKAQRETSAERTRADNAEQRIAELEKQLAQLQEKK